MKNRKTSKVLETFEVFQCVLVTQSSAKSAIAHLKHHASTTQALQQQIAHRYGGRNHAILLW